MNLLTLSVFFLIVLFSVADFPVVLIDFLALPTAVLESLVQFLWGQVPCELATPNATPDQISFYRFDRILRQKVLITPPYSLIFPQCVKIIVHGYIHNSDTPWVTTMANSYHNQEYCLVILVDWRVPAQQVYPISAQNTKIVG